ncbi:hypothetical protein IKT64_00870 [Candidatus Saccharibacteria bacterium]|nr:hypothetical protein [Candidatus Saccharibacteria bacterium]
MIDQKRKKLIIIAAVAVVVILLTVVIIKKIIGTPVELRIMVAPASSKIEIDGKTYENGSYEIRDGKHKAIISKEGFTTQEIEFIARANEMARVETYLIQNDGGEDWYETHPEDDGIRWFVVESQSQERTNALYDKNPILNKLPITVEYYSKNYTSHTKYEITAKINDDYSAFTIEISDYTGGNQDNALDKIREAGFNPDNYTINYHDYSKDTGWGQAF